MTHELAPHFFRQQSGRLVAALARVFGVHNLTMAEDAAQETLCRALEVWKIQGVPAQPEAWLLTSARNHVIDVLRRQRTARSYAPELGRQLDSEWTLVPTVYQLLEVGAMRDDELRMMFSLCQPSLPEEAQIALVLHILCGFSVGEIAAAFFASPAAIEKRITRAKQVLAESQRLFDLNSGDIGARLGAVQGAIYLLFNEGYHGASAEAAVREALCHDALRLVELLAEHPLTGTPSTQALAGLLFLHASRLSTRVGADGQFRTLFEQDRTRWDVRAIERGLAFLERSANGGEITEYHLEAAIASLHATAPSRDATRWADIVAIYDNLMQLRPSPVVALSRAIAIAELDGAQRGLEALDAIEGSERLASYPFYEAARGELLLRLAAPDRARVHFQNAMALARSPMERRFFEERALAAAGGTAVE